ncbi:hypothetical protein AB7783_07125 [Tardiphaga sp. 172_B4_N1_3]|uniref:hypothetical protein n=1 Tax=Tardiphaga sp. 172_B4_N1_3 TaxID=3240787 RepID=UPI003F89AB93
MNAVTFVRQSDAEAGPNFASGCRNVIVFARRICYSDPMEHRIQIDPSKKQARGFRRGLLMVLAFVYLFVGVAHQISCFDQAVASTFGIEKVADVPYDGGSPSELALCDHCPTCAPAVMPAPVMEAAPCGLPASTTILVASFSAADHAWLDSPPPKFLT